MRLFTFAVFFFTQKTPYELRISDWSSDVCSSDLLHCIDAVAAHIPTMSFDPRPPCRNKMRLSTALPLRNLAAPASLLPVRSEERRVGKGCFSSVDLAGRRFIKKNNQ